MKKPNEKDIIKIFQKQLGNKKFVSEDVEVLNLGKTKFVMKIDTLVESTDIPKGMSILDCVRKSVVACISDFAAKGVKPRFGMVSVTIPRKFSQKKISDLASGLAKAAKEFQIKILGGDTNEGKELVIQVSIFGIAKNIVQRKGARVNDSIITTGPFGYSISGLKIILNKKKSSKTFSSKAKKSVFRPNPRLRFGILNRKNFTSSMDSSDGLSLTLHEMATQSKKRFEITKLPANQDLFEFARLNKIKPQELIFHGGEEYEIVATVPPKNLAKVKKNARSQNIPLFVIGKVTKGRGVVYSHDDKITKIKNKGWLHFQS